MANHTAVIDAATDRGRGRWPLHVMIFLVTGVLVLLAVGSGIGLTWWQGARLADDAVQSALGRARSAQDEFQSLRFRQIELMADMLASDPPFVAYVDEAIGVDLFGDSEGVDQASLRDELADRRGQLGFDLAVVFDATGVLLAHSERAVPGDEDFTDLPLIGEAVADLVPVSGLWHEGARVYQLAVVPLEREFSLIGFVAVGLLVDDALVDEVKQVSGAEVIWLVGGDIIASTFAADQSNAVVGELGRMGALAEVAGSGQEMTAKLSVDGARWVGRVYDVGGGADEPVMVASLISLDRIQSGYRSMQISMLVAGAITFALALALSLAMARRVTGPLTTLAAAAKAAEDGAFTSDFEDHQGSAEVIELSHSFASLLAELKEKRDMEQYVSDLSRYLPDPSVEDGRSMVTEGALEPATYRPLSLLAIELRDLSAAAAQNIDSTVRSAEETALWLSSSARDNDAQLEFFTGQRAMISVAGDDAPLRAVLIASTLSHRFGGRLSMALIAGPISRASIRLEGKVHRLLIGKAALQADLLLEEAPPGVLLIAPNLKDRLVESLEEAAVKVAVGTGRLSGRRYLALDQAALSQIEQATSHRTAAIGDDATEAPPAAVQRTVVTGDLFADRFEIVSILGRGGMGVVYKAFDRELEDFVALKTLLPEIADNASYLSQLKDEIKLARRITHANVLRTYDFGLYDGMPFISMEYVRGLTLRYLLEQRRQLPFSAALRVARQLAAGLAVAHQQDVIHRDIKPENLILEASGNAKLMDFGIASPMERMRDAEGVFVGTPIYASPEQMEGKPLDAGADIYACGILMYEMFCGQRPIPGGSMMDIYSAKVEESFDPPDALDPPLQHRLSSIIMRCLRPRPDERYANATELEAALRGARNG